MHFDVFSLCRDDAKRLADKLKKVTVADIVDSMEVSVMPFAVHDDQTCSIYKLKMKLYKPKHYPKHANISVKDWEEILEVVYVRELEDAIQNHMVLLSKISGIKDFSSGLPPRASNEDGEVSVSRSQNKGENDDDVDDEDGVETEDLGLDAQKQKQQATDERDYEDDSEEELNEGSSAGFGSEIDQAENDDEHDESEKEIENDQVENEVEISKDQTSESLSHLEESSIRSPSKKTAKRKKKARAKLVKKETDRSIYVAAKGYHFEVHFKFINEPHILLAQVGDISMFLGLLL